MSVQRRHIRPSAEAALIDWLDTSDASPKAKCRAIWKFVDAGVTAGHYTRAPDEIRVRHHILADLEFLLDRHTARSSSSL